MLERPDETSDRGLSEGNPIAILATLDFERGCNRVTRFYQISLVDFFENGRRHAVIYDRIYLSRDSIYWTEETPHHGTPEAKVSQKVNEEKEVYGGEQH